MQCFTSNLNGVVKQLEKEAAALRRIASVRSGTTLRIHDNVNPKVVQLVSSPKLQHSTLVIVQSAGAGAAGKSTASTATAKSMNMSSEAWS